MLQLAFLTSESVVICYIAAPPNITIDSAVNDVIYGDNVTLRCKVDSQIPIVEAFWDTVLQGRINVDASSLPCHCTFICLVKGLYVGSII
jgi:hypothetical protein